MDVEDSYLAEVMEGGSDRGRGGGKEGEFEVSIRN